MMVRFTVRSGWGLSIVFLARQELYNLSILRKGSCSRVYAFDLPGNPPFCFKMFCETMLTLRRETKGMAALGGARDSSLGGHERGLTGHAHD